MHKSGNCPVKTAILSIMLLAACLGAGAQEPPGRTFALHTTGKMYMDGNLTEPDWQRAEVIGSFLLHPQKTAEKDITEARILWDDECLYIAFKCHDAHISGTKTERNTAVFEDDCVEAFICPVPRNFERYTNIEINAIGTYNSRVCGEKPVEGLAGRPGVTDPTSPRAHWFPPGLQIGRSHQGTMNNDTDEDSWWVIEMSIPFKSFEVLGWSRTPADGDVWRYNLYRLGGKVDPQRSSLFPLSEGANNHSPKDFGTLVFRTATWPLREAGPGAKGEAVR